MNFLEERIIKDGFVLNNDILKVDSFINHQIDTKLLRQISKDISSNFGPIDKVLTIETSGIAFATGVAMEKNDVPVVFAKKSKSAIVDFNNAFHANVTSFTRKIDSIITVDKRFLKEGERVLIVDDFLAEGNASLGLIQICKDAGCVVEGVAVVVEKRFQGGRDKLQQLGYKVYSCASIVKFENNQPVFAE